MWKSIVSLCLAIALATLFGGCAQNPQKISQSGNKTTSTPDSAPTMGVSPPPHRVRSAHRSPASTEAASPADADAALEKAADNLPLGQVAIQHPQQMRVKKPDIVRVAITRDQKLDLLKELPSSGQETEQGKLAVSASMKVHVSGAPYFDVQPLSDEEQLIPDQGTTQWSFNVTPLQGGKLPLHVTIAAVVRAAGIEKTRDFPVKDEIIQVRVSPVAAVTAFIAGNWQWLWSTLLVPFALWLGKRMRVGRAPAGPELLHAPGRKSKGRGAA